MRMIEIINKLIGSVSPYGDSNIDKERYKNLDLLGEMTVDLVSQLGDVAYYRNHMEKSMKDMGELAYDDLIIIKEYIETIIK